MTWLSRSAYATFDGLSLALSASDCECASCARHPARVAVLLVTIATLTKQSYLVQTVQHTHSLPAHAYTRICATTNQPTLHIKNHSESDLTARRSCPGWAGQLCTRTMHTHGWALPRLLTPPPAQQATAVSPSLTNQDPYQPQCSCLVHHSQQPLLAPPRQQQHLVSVNCNTCTASSVTCWCSSLLLE